MNAQWFLKRWVFCMVLVGLTGALIVWLLAPETPTIQLKDGSILRLEHVHYQRSAPDGLLRRGLNTARIWLAQRLGRPVFLSSFAPENSLVYWIAHRDKASGAPLAISSWASEAIALDSDGCEFQATSPGTVFLPSSAGGVFVTRRPQTSVGANNMITSGMFTVFPRREKTFRLRLYDARHSVVGEFKVRNPVFCRYPTWKPEHLPIQRSAGNATVSLIGLANEWTEDGYPFGMQGKHFSLTPEFQLPSAWELGGLDVEDATGNRAATAQFNRFARLRRPFSLGQRLDPFSAEFKLCTNESAWKLRATFFRTAGAQFASNETWTIPDFKIPAPGTVRRLRESNAWQGVSVQLCAAAGPGEVTYSNGVPISVGSHTGRRKVRTSGRNGGGVSVSEITIGTDRPQLLIRVLGLNDPARLMVLVRSGSRISLGAQLAVSSEYRVFDFDSPNDAEIVDLIFVIQQPKAFDFFIRPVPPASVAK